MKAVSEQICIWISKNFASTYPYQLLDLCELDTDLNLGIEGVLHKGITSNKAELI